MIRPARRNLLVAAAAFACGRRPALAAPTSPLRRLIWVTNQKSEELALQYRHADDSVAAAPPRP